MLHTCIVCHHIMPPYQALCGVSKPYWPSFSLASGVLVAYFLHLVSLCFVSTVLTLHTSSHRYTSIIIYGYVCAINKPSVKRSRSGRTFHSTGKFAIVAVTSL